MLENRPFIAFFSVLALVVMLAACDSGGVSTSANPNLSIANNGFVYTGPAARNIDVANFKTYLYDKVNIDTRCGGCHNSQASSPVSPLFFDTSNVNIAYDESISRVDLVNPTNSVFVAKLNSGHFCWETVSAVCAGLISDWIEDWKNAANGGVSSRQINLVVPDSIRDPGDAKSFPDFATTVGTNGTSFANTVYPLLVGTNPVIANNNCRNCHEEIATPLPQAPFFASGDVESAFQAAKAKMDIDTPPNSRFVERMVQLHNCWTADCSTDPVTSDAARMTQVIQAFADGIAPTPVDPTLFTSMALGLSEGIVASGGNRHETNQFAIWEFKIGTGLTAFDTSGLDPAINLSLIGSVAWIGGYGLEFNGGRAQANTINSDKLYTYIQTTGEYAIEAWVSPNNVSQEDTNIVSYSGGDTARNFTLGQTLYNYEAFNRIDTIPPAPNGDPFLTTGENGEEIAQASLQHVVVNYDPFNGRSIYVNGQLINVTDPVAGATTISNVWDDTFAFILGNEISGQRPWMGQIKMVAMHNRALTPAQIQQNFDVGVGQKFFLLFYVGHHLGETLPDPNNPNPNLDASFIMFEVAQFDSFSYLFNKPTFINLNPAWVPGTIDIEGLRIGINGKEALAGQAYASMDTVVNAAGYDPALGQELSPMGTVIALEKGPDSDEFFLTFELIDAVGKTFVEVDPTVPSDPADPASPVESDIGVRTFEEISLTISEITGVPVSNAAVRSVYNDYFQQLPTVEAIGAFLPSHQMAIAQLALTSCSELVNGNGSISRTAYFPGFSFTTTAQSAFVNQGQRDSVIDPLLTAAMNVDQLTPANNLTTQPVEVEISNLLGSTASQNLDTGTNIVAYDSLITEMLSTGVDTTARTEQVVKAVCAVATGGAVMLVQ
ncbi:MAG: LamG domain-containing protein [Gammaproteobacteria bacterium]|nr:LamG domain-containing protein [Gammaproteobacteria bacterium]